MPKPRPSERTQARRLAVGLAVLLAVFAALSLFRHHIGRAELFAGAGALALLLAFAAMPVWLRIYRAWMQAAAAISWVLTRVILTVFFYGMFTPFCLVWRLVGKPPLDLGWGDGRSSCWVAKTGPPPGPDQYRKLY